jgi:hypothetical protein
VAVLETLLAHPEAPEGVLVIEFFQVGQAPQVKEITVVAQGAQKKALVAAAERVRQVTPGARSGVVMPAVPAVTG